MTIKGPLSGTAEIRFLGRDTVFCWSAVRITKIQNAGNFKLKYVFAVSLVDSKTKANLAPTLKT